MLGAAHDLALQLLQGVQDARDYRRDADAGRLMLMMQACFAPRAALVCEAVLLKPKTVAQHTGC